MSVVSTQDGADLGGWNVDLYAAFPDAVLSRMYVGTITISAVNPGTKRPARILAVASIPGACAWFAEVRSPSPSPANPMQLGLFAGEISLTSAGLTLVDP